MCATETGKTVVYFYVWINEELMETYYSNNNWLFSVCLSLKHVKIMHIKF